MIIIRNQFLFTGGPYLPKSVTGRTFICHWWAFAIIIVASYGGSLIAYLTISKSEAPFTDLDGMVAQTRYKWGFRQGTIYHNAFKNANGGIYKKLWNGLQQFTIDDPDIETSSIVDQLRKVNEGDYVYIADRTPLLVQVISNEECNLVLLSEIFMPLPFGIGLQLGSTYKHIIAKRYG